MFSTIFLFLFLFFFLGLSSSFLSPPCDKSPFFKLKKYASLLCPRINCLASFYKNRHRLLQWYTDLLSRSPSQTVVVHRLGSVRTVVTANPENVEYLLKKNFGNFPKGEPFTELLGDFLGLGIFNVDGENWRVQRKLATREFSANSLREFVVKVLEEEVRTRLIPVLENVAENYGILDLQEVLKRFAFDNICKVALGMQSPPQLEAAFDAASARSAMRGNSPVSGFWKLKRALNVGSERDLREAVGVVHGCVDEIIREKKKGLLLGAANGNGGSDLLLRFLKAGVADELVRDMVISFMMAGRDTTSSALTWLFWLLTCHRKIEKQIMEEINKVHKELGFDDLKEMDFIKACLYESMRLYPPVVWDSKHAANDDVLPDGTPVYRGDRVTYFPYGMGRMESLWGEDRLDFKPDRWFNEDGNLKTVSAYKFPVFQAGPRVCLGKEMAMVQMKYVVASVLRKFEFVPVRSETPVFVPLLTAYMAGGLNVRVRRRELMH